MRCDVRGVAVSAAARPIACPAPEPPTPTRERWRRRRDVRARTVSAQRTGKRQLEVIRTLADADLEAAGDFFSPTTRGDCANVVRPCPHVSCKHHLYLDVSDKTMSVKINFPDLEPDELPPDGSCALDVADRGGMTLENVGAIMNLTRERVRQIEERAIAKAGPALQELLRDRDDGDAGPGRRRLPVLDEDLFAADALDATDVLDVGGQIAACRGDRYPDSTEGE